MNIKSLTRLSMLAATMVVGLGLSQPLLAVPGQCLPDDGENYNIPFSPVFDEPSQNVAGKIIYDADQGKWNLASIYHGTCECTTLKEVYFSAKMLLTEQVYTDGKINFFKLNDYLAVGTEVWLGGGANGANQFFPAPFDYTSNRNTTEMSCVYARFNSGAKGKVHLYFIRPFVGQTVIPSTRILEVYAATIPGVSSPVPLTHVSLSGTVTVPQSCEIGPQPLEIDFGDIMSADFTTKGAMPRNFTPERKEITVGCRNISDGVKVSLSFQAEPDPSDPSLLKTSNGDIAVQLQDGGGSAISPTNGTLPVNFDYSSQQGNAEIVAYPKNTTGKTPEVGDFNATATIKAEIE